jgi:hypothetical protein
LARFSRKSESCAGVKGPLGGNWTCAINN